METDLRQKVKKYYGEKVSEKNERGCCSQKTSCCDTISNTDIIYDSEFLNGIPKDAINASFGCANPLLFAELKEGEVVLDLGSGGGIDVLMAAKYVGESGKVYGLDMTEEMLELANKNRVKAGAKNVEFIKGFLEEIPLEAESIDVIISNCVINLTEDKELALSEGYRVLKKGGRVAIADIVGLKKINPQIKKIGELWCGCIAGTLEIEEYRDILKKVGFKDIQIDPIHIYSRGVIQEILKEKEIKETPEFDLDEIDGAFAGALIKAVK